MPVKSMDELFLDTLKDIYYAEKQIFKSLPKMAWKSAIRSPPGRALGGPGCRPVPGTPWTWCAPPTSSGRP